MSTGFRLMALAYFISSPSHMYFTFTTPTASFARMRVPGKILEQWADIEAPQVLLAFLRTRFDHNE